MFALVVHEEDRPAWRKAFTLREVRIGSASGNDLVLVDPQVSARHARLVLRDGKYILVDLKSATGTWIAGRRLAVPQVLRERVPFTIGRARIEIVALAYEELGRRSLIPRDRTEADLLAAIDDGDGASRLVYADWLEARGDHARAELLRIQHELVDEADPAVIDVKQARMRELGASIDLPWRAHLSQLPIENCPQFSFKCPRQWSELAPTTADGERFCGDCRRTVYYCATIDEARTHAAEGRCVAIDLASPRWSGDLDAPFGERVCDACALDVGAGLRECPRCGAQVGGEMMLLGELA